MKMLSLIARLMLVSAFMVVGLNAAAPVPSDADVAAVQEIIQFPVATINFQDLADKNIELYAFINISPEKENDVKEIGTTIRKMSLANHPDKGTAALSKKEKEARANRFKLIQFIKSVLVDSSDNKANYDAWHNAEAIAREDAQEEEDGIAGLAWSKKFFSAQGLTVSDKEAEWIYQNETQLRAEIFGPLCYDSTTTADPGVETIQNYIKMFGRESIGLLQGTNSFSIANAIGWCSEKAAILIIKTYAKAYPDYFSKFLTDINEEYIPLLDSPEEVAKGKINEMRKRALGKIAQALQLASIQAKWPAVITSEEQAFLSKSLFDEVNGEPNVSTVSELIKLGADVNYKDESNSSILELAYLELAYNDDLRTTNVQMVISLLKKAGATGPVLNDLFAALKIKNINLVKSALARKPDLLANNPSPLGHLNALPALHFAARHGFVAAIPLLINAGANVNQQLAKKSNKTALHYAVEGNGGNESTTTMAAVVTALRKAGADTSLKTEATQTLPARNPLEYAIYKKTDAFVREALETPLAAPKRNIPGRRAAARATARATAASEAQTKTPDADSSSGGISDID